MDHLNQKSKFISYLIVLFLTFTLFLMGTFFIQSIIISNQKYTINSGKDTQNFKKDLTELKHTN